MVEVLPAFTKQPVGEVQFVQYRAWHQRARVRELFEQGATVYVCGDDRRMAPAVRELLGQEATGASEAEVQRFAADVERRGRYVADVFS